MALREKVPLAPFSTLGVGGPARYFLEAEDDSSLVEALTWAREEGLPAVLLGGGSNVVVADSGVAGLVVRIAQRGVTAGSDEAGGVRWSVAAGEPWDLVVARAVAEGLAGLECLSGIPGTAGATPIQNVGAYGQEISEALESVRVLDRESLDVRELAADECELSYRDSLFRRHPDRFAVLSVTLRLAPGGPPALRYPELQRAVADSGAGVTLDTVRRVVLALRRAKSMVLLEGDENRRSVGSFFVNPVLGEAETAGLVERAVAAGMVDEPSEVPRFEVGGGRVKLPAGWLIERAGFPRGTRRGAVGLSSRHALALVHHGGGRAADLLALARDVRDRVAERFDVTLRPEPVFLGFDEPPL